MLRFDPRMTANPPRPVAEAERRALIRRRRETSAFWLAIHLLGSLNLAVTLLIIIAGAIAFATIMESKFDSDVAGYYIYHAAWFNFWLLALGLNLFCAALTRWPWQRKHVGFVVTHAGIILLLIGAVIGRLIGFEAFVTLDKTKPAESRLVTKEDVLTVATAEGEEGELPFNIAMHPPTEAHPFRLPLEKTNLALVVDRATANLIPNDTLVASADPAAPPGVALHFLNAGMKQDVAANLVLDDESSTFDFFGMAAIKIVPSLPEDQPIALPPPAPDATTFPRDDTPFRETQVIFASSPQAPVIDTNADTRCGYEITLAPAPGKIGALEVTVTAPGGVSTTYPLADLQKGWKDLLGDGDPIHFRIAKYWPDFAIQNGLPASLSNQPRNPAILVQITGPSRLLPPPVAKPAPPAPLPKGLVMRVAPAREPGRIVYELEREGKIEARATAAVGDTIRLGWSKWLARVDAVPLHAELHRDLREFTAPVTPQMAASLRPGIRAHLTGPGGATGPVEWIPAGSSRELFCGNDFARIGFGRRTIPLAYTITLENFEVPRDEGTDTPANFISTLRFTDPATGRVVHDRAFMNSPAMYPGDFWRSLLGWNYKFSQANWDPQNLNETTLQVLYDPGWPLKWTGSLGICCGIILMFYFMPKRSPEERGGREPLK
jgi:hypothetical protein